MFRFVTFLLLTLNISPAFADGKPPFSVPRSQVIELADEHSKRVYPIYIKLPRGYHRNEDKYYPVIYITDANYAFQIVSGATRFPMNTNSMEQAILVGISYSKEARGDHSRIRDFTPTYAKSWKKLTGEGPTHVKFINDVVFNYVDTHFRTDTSNRTFIGNSLGGLFGAYILLTKPDMFKNYVLGSPSFWFNEKMIFDLEQSAQVNKTTSQGVYRHRRVKNNKTGWPL